jgi:hypothetical protein
MESVYGQDFENKALNIPALTNAYVQGYRDKEGEDKTARGLMVSPSRRQWFIDNIPAMDDKKFDKVLPNMGKFFGLEIIQNDKMPQNLGAMVDSEGSIISFIEFTEK